MPPLNQGQVVPGDYRIERELGQGGMGAVYEAIELASGHKFAIKVLHEELRRHPVIPKRFVQEAMAARVLVTPHAVKVRTTGALADGTPFIVMEYLDGIDLGTAMKRSGGRLTIDRALLLLDQAAEALQEAHAKGIVHRDLKPDNIFIIQGPQGEFVKVVDFGISKIVTRDEGAKLTMTGMTVGTPQYMAPEQLRGVKDLDGRADVYALGILLYEVLAGVRPYDGFTYEDVILKVITETPAPLSSYRPDIPQELVAIIDRAMARDRSVRVSSMQEFRHLIAPFLAQRPHLPNQVAIDASFNAAMDSRRVSRPGPDPTLPMAETVGARLGQSVAIGGAYGSGPGATPAPPLALSQSSSNLGSSPSIPGPQNNPSLSNSSIQPSLLANSGAGIPTVAHTKGASRSIAASVITALIVGLIALAVVAILALGGAGAWLYMKSEPNAGPSAAPSSATTSPGGRGENLKQIPTPKKGTGRAQ